MAPPAGACSLQLLQHDRLKRAADAVVVARVAIERVERYRMDGVENRRGVAMATPVRVVRGDRLRAYRIVFDSEDDGVNCPRWTPFGRDKVQRLYLAKTNNPGEYEVLTTGN
jgi:hypothetical protein